MIAVVACLLLGAVMVCLVGLLVLVRLFGARWVGGSITRAAHRVMTWGQGR